MSDRLKQLIANMRIIKRDCEVTDTLNKLKCQLGDICPYTPCFEVHINDDEKLLIFSYSDDDGGREELYDEVQSILNDEAYSGNHITVMYVTWGEYVELLDEWTRNEKILIALTIP